MEGVVCRMVSFLCIYHFFLRAEPLKVKQANGVNTKTVMSYKPTPPLTPPPLSSNYMCGCGFSSGGSAQITTHQANHAYLMNWWGCTHKNYILTNTVHIFEKVLPDYIIIISDDHVLGMKKITAVHL